jgi:hypothetical protein
MSTATGQDAAVPTRYPLWWVSKYHKNKASNGKSIDDMSFRLHLGQTKCTVLHHDLVTYLPAGSPGIGLTLWLASLARFKRRRMGMCSTGSSNSSALPQAAIHSNTKAHTVVTSDDR